MNKIILEYLKSEDLDTIMVGLELLKTSGMDEEEMKKYLKGTYAIFPGRRTPNKPFYHPGNKINERDHAFVNPPGIYLKNKTALLEKDPNRGGHHSYYKYLGPL